MVFRAFYEIWRKRRAQLEREQRRAQERLRRARAEEDQERAEQQENEDLVVAVLVSEDQRRFLEELNRDIDDAIAVARLAYERAAAAQERAAATLARVQDNALLLGNGRRFYFSADGSALYDEERRQITDVGLLSEAESLRQHSPAVTTLEELDRAEQTLEEAKGNAEALAALLERLDELRERTQSGELSPDELAQARIDLDEIVAALPAEAREEYEALAARRDESEAERTAESVFDSAAVLKSDFERASSRFAEDEATTSDLPPANNSTPRSER